VVIAQAGAASLHRQAFETIQAGDVLVIDARGDISARVTGDILATRLKYRGAAALVTDGAIGDLAAMHQEDALGIRDRDLIGVDQMMWGSDYPHTESTFPQSQKLLDRVFAGVPDDERRRITRDNAARLYGFDVT
jgi:hypothetical protein